MLGEEAMGSRSKSSSKSLSKVLPRILNKIEKMETNKNNKIAFEWSAYFEQVT